MSSILENFVGKLVVVQTNKPTVASHCVGYDEEKECAVVEPIQTRAPVPDGKGGVMKDPATGEDMFRQVPLETIIHLGEVVAWDSKGFVLETTGIINPDTTMLLYIPHENCASMTMSLSAPKAPEEKSPIITP